MSEETPTRQQTVEANIEAAIAKYGEENALPLIVTMLQDISVSLALLVDAGSGS